MLTTDNETEFIQMNLIHTLAQLLGIKRIYYYTIPPTG